MMKDRERRPAHSSSLSLHSMRHATTKLDLSKSCKSDAPTESSSTEPVLSLLFLCLFFASKEMIEE
jgi:hypothetical protein